MKQMKLMLSAFVIVSIVGTALAFKPLNSGQIYCTTPGDHIGPCPSTALVQYIEDTNGSVINPCAPPLTPHRTVTINGTTICQDMSSSFRFREVFD